MSDQDRVIWNRVADEFDNKIGLNGDRDPFRARCVDSMLLRALTEEGVRDGARVLDVGSGNGYFVRKLWAHGYDADGLDISDGLLGIARARSPGRVFHQADIEATATLPHTKWDAITCSFVLDGLKNLDAALSGLHLLLSPGGVLIVNIPHPAFIVPGTYGGAVGVSKSYAEQDDPEGSDYTMHHCKHPVRYYWRPLSKYVNAIVRSGFQVKSLIEPDPAELHEYIGATERPRQRAYVLCIVAKREANDPADAAAEFVAA